MHKRNKFISLGLSFILAAMPVSSVAAAEFSDGTAYTSDTEFEDGTEGNVEGDTEITAEEPSDEEASFKENMIPDADDTTDNEKLLEEYLNRILYEQDLSTQPGTSVAESVLSGVQQALYEELKSKITTVASKVALRNLVSVQILD